VAKNSIGRTIIFIATAAAFAFGAPLASAAGGGIPGSSGSHQGGELAPAASPYAILAPVTIENTPGGEGRAAFEGRPSLCSPGAHEIATNSGIRCKPNR
jgi:hypothetical protein